MVELHAIEKRYGPVHALRNVSITIDDGEFFALLGPNGAGKTSLIRILLDFTRPTSGYARIDGIACTNFRARFGIGYLPENMLIPSYLSGRAFIKRQISLGGLSGKHCEAEIDRLFELVDMTDKADAASGTYSKGMLQRIGLAAALAGSPHLLILDEPTNGLDPIGIRKFRTILERLKTDHITVLLNSHILSEVEKLCTTAAILNKGNLVVKDSINNLIRTGESLEDVFVKYIGAA